MKKQGKGFFTGLVIGLMVMLLVGTAFAANANRTADLQYRDIKINLDGQELIPRDVTGAIVEPFIINGTTYLPIRAVAEALGVGVDWDQENYTVLLDSDQPGPAVSRTTQGHMTIAVYDYGDAKLHVIYSNDVMADVSYIVEGKDSLVAIEAPAFADDLKEWAAYIEKLGKPMNDMFADVHPATDTYVKGMNIYGTKGAQDSITGGSTYATIQGLTQAFGEGFVDGGKPANINKVVSGTVTVAGIEFQLLDRGETYDLAIPSMNVVYTHMLGKYTHSILESEAQIDATLADLKEFQAAGYDMVICSHGGPEGQDAVAEKISYLNRTKTILANSKTGDEFAAAMKAAFPHYVGENYLEMSVGALFPAK